MRIREMMRLGHAVGGSDVSRIETISAAALNRDPRDFMALAVLADTYWREQRDEDALKYALQVLEVDPTLFHALRIVADTYAKRGDHIQAYPYVKRSVAARPPIKPSGAFLVRLLGALRWVPKLRRMHSNITREDTSYCDWMVWANDYISWYESREKSAH